MNFDQIIKLMNFDQIINTAQARWPTAFNDAVESMGDPFDQESLVCSNTRALAVGLKGRNMNHVWDALPQDLKLMLIDVSRHFNPDDRESFDLDDHTIRAVYAFKILLRKAYPDCIYSILDWASDPNRGGVYSGGKPGPFYYHVRQWIKSEIQSQPEVHEGHGRVDRVISKIVSDGTK